MAVYSRALTNDTIKFDMSQEKNSHAESATRHKPRLVFDRVIPDPLITYSLDAECPLLALSRHR
jgi:hypothetical protein